MSKCKYSITLDPENDIVRVVARGELVKELGEEIITKARLTAAKHQYHILCDVRHAEAIVSFADWFFLPKTLPVYKDNETRTIKTALIISPGNQESEYRFYETVMHNKGMNLRIFLKEEEAVEWLKESYRDTKAQLHLQRNWSTVKDIMVVDERGMLVYGYKFRPVM